MNKYTIFGEENFIDKSMIEITAQQDNLIVNEIYKTAVKMDISIDKGKLEKWLRLCVRLDDIDKDELIDFAIRKKFGEKDNQIAELKKQLEEEKELFLDSDRELREANTLTDELKKQLESECAEHIAFMENANKYVNGLIKGIKHLEKRLANAIEPKFKIGQKVWWVSPLKVISEETVIKIEMVGFNEKPIYQIGLHIGVFDTELFATQAEAALKLKEGR